MWIYFALEDGGLRPEDASTSLRLIVSVTNHARRISREYDERLAFFDGILVSSLYLSVREAMERGGVPFSLRSALGYDKWLFKVDELPSGEPGISDGMYWAPAFREDCLFVISRNYLSRQVYGLRI